MQLEYKAFPFEHRNEDNGRFTGYAAAYAKDVYGDRIVPGAFAKTIKQKKGKIPIFYNHNDTVIPLGFSSELVEDAKGLYIDALLSLDSTNGRDVYALLKTAKAVDFKMGLSIGFIAIDEDDDGEGRLLKSIDLWETSITPYPANRAAKIDGFKSLRNVEQILRDAGGCSRAEAKRALAGLYPYLSVDADGSMPETVRDARHQRQLNHTRAFRAALGD